MTVYRCSKDLFGYCGAPGNIANEQDLKIEGGHLIPAINTCPHTPKLCGHYLSQAHLPPISPPFPKTERSTIEI